MVRRDLHVAAESGEAVGLSIVLASGASFSFSIDRDLTLNVGETHTNVATVVVTDDEGKVAPRLAEVDMTAEHTAPSVSEFSLERVQAVEVEAHALELGALLLGLGDHVLDVLEGHQFLQLGMHAIPPSAPRRSSRSRRRP